MIPFRPVRLVSNVFRGDTSFTETSSHAQTPRFLRQTFRARRAGCSGPKDCDGDRSLIGGSPVAPRQEARSRTGVLRWFEVIRRIDTLGSSHLLSRSDRATFAMP